MGIGKGINSPATAASVDHMTIFKNKKKYSLDSKPTPPTNNTSASANANIGNTGNTGNTGQFIHHRQTPYNMTSMTHIDIESLKPIGVATTAWPGVLKEVIAWKERERTILPLRQRFHALMGRQDATIKDAYDFISKFDRECRRNHNLVHTQSGRLDVTPIMAKNIPNVSQKKNNRMRVRITYGDEEKETVAHKHSAGKSKSKSGPSLGPSPSRSLSL